MNDLLMNSFLSVGFVVNLGLVIGNVIGDVLYFYLVNVNFGFDNIFFFLVFVCVDGFSCFVNDCWGIFLGVFVGVNLVNVGVFDVVIFDLFKLCVSYGVMGNNNIGNFIICQLFGGGVIYLIIFGIMFIQIGNFDLVWEIINQFDVGVDLVFLDNKIGVIIEYYVKNIFDLILNCLVLIIFGFLIVLENIGDMCNIGIDLVLIFVLFSGDFSWIIIIIVGFLINEVVEVFNDQLLDFGFVICIEEGQFLGFFYGWVMDGIFQNVDEVVVYVIQFNVVFGDICFKDLNGDGVINDVDCIFIGQVLFDVVGGIDNKFSYKGLDLSVFLQYIFGNEIYNNNFVFVEGLNFVFVFIVCVFEGVWCQEGDGDDFLCLVNGDFNGNCCDFDCLVEDGFFVCIKIVQLGYNFLQSMLGNGFCLLCVYIQGINLVIWINYSWFDFEVSIFGDVNVVLGIDFLISFQFCIVQFGLNFGF